MNKGDYVVINLDSEEGKGTHWVAALNAPHENTVLYFDSFGISPCQQIEKYCRSSGKELVYNSSEQQQLESNRCGFFCTYVIEKVASGKSYYDTLYSLSQVPSSENEKLVKGKNT